MKGDKINRKVQYTRKVLKESFIQLLKQKAISGITVTQICREADINRATFYAHYKDQYDLLSQIEQELVADINKYLAEYRFQERNMKSRQVMEQIFEYIRENSEVCEVLLGENGDKIFQRDVLLIVQQQCISEWTRKDVDEDVAQYLYSYTTNGSIGIIQKWLQEGMTRSNGEMAEFIIKLNEQGLSAFV